MPIHSLGYREWSGQLDSARSRWTVIACVGIRRAWQSMWLRRIVFFAWIPGVMMAMLIYLFEQAASEGQASAFMTGGIVQLFLGRTEREAIRDTFAVNASAIPDLVKYRHAFWCSLLQVLYQRSQAIMLIPVVGIPLPLISYGGTAMMTVLFSLGLLMCIFVHRDERLTRTPGIDAA